MYRMGYNSNAARRSEMIIARQLGFRLECQTGSHLHVGVIFLGHAGHGLVLWVGIRVSGSTTVQKERGNGECEE